MTCLRELPSVVVNFTNQNSLLSLNVADEPQTFIEMLAVIAFCNGRRKGLADEANTHRTNFFQSESLNDISGDFLVRLSGLMH